VVAPALQKKIARAMQLQRDNDLARAEELYREVLARDGHHLVGLHLLSALLLQTGRSAQAVELLRRAVARAPQQAIFHANLGEAYRRLDRSEESKASLRRAIALRPDLAEAHCALGMNQLDDGQFDEALASLARAATLKPGLADAHNYAGIALHQQGRVEEALEAFRRALAAQPDHRGAHSNYVFLLAWRQAPDAPSIAREAREWAARQLSPELPAPLPHDNDRDPHRRLRVGYVSPDFREHCQALFLIPLLEHHDREAVEVYCYSFVQHPDDVTRRIRGLAHAFRDIAPLTDPAAADLVRADGVDILVDLTMHMGNNRMPLFARKPAPLQVAWLAYPGTTGLPAMDYRMTDVYLDPPEVDTTGWYTEESLRLPDSFWCYDPLTGAPEVDALPARRDGRDGPVTFGCLNSFGKTNADVFALWSRVLGAVEGSRLVLLAPPGESRGRVQRAFASAGVDPGRIEFVGFQPRREYLSTYRRIDVCLDTFPVNGHTTSLDSFWMGVPVITLVGPTVLGRAGLCYAHNLGLPELVATTPDQYVAIAANLAHDMPRLETLRREVRPRMGRSPLMNGSLFARNFESVYRRIWQRWCRSPARGS
jgi:protein O-GlcNAc transferase